MYIQRGNKTEPEKRRGERLRGTKGERERERQLLQGLSKGICGLKLYLGFYSILFYNKIILFWLLF